jgi:aspartate kinase
MGAIAAKFGGSSLADAGHFKKVRAIIGADDRRRYVIPSAPGKRYNRDRKVTDLLYACYGNAGEKETFDPLFDRIEKRYREIIADLKLDYDIGPILKEVRHNIRSGASADYTASRGEYLNGLIMAAYLGYDFVDPVEMIFFDGEGRYDHAASRKAVEERLSRHERAVIPGFYGSGPDGQVKTFTRGGSDITGAIVAGAIGAELYENWTDVDGFLMADPSIVDNPRPIDYITYKELRELSYMGAKVLHEDAIFPVKHAGISINIRNTDNPKAPGTMIVGDDQTVPQTGRITGVAGKKNFTAIRIEKALMNSQIGFARKLLSIVERHGISFEHIPSGIDSISLVVSDSELAGKADVVLMDIKEDLEPDNVYMNPHMSLIATVGLGMAKTPGMASRLFTALSESGINVRMIDQGSSELNIIIGVENEQYESAIRVIYEAFI